MFKVNKIDPKNIGLMVAKLDFGTVYFGDPFLNISPEEDGIIS